MKRKLSRFIITHYVLVLFPVRMICRARVYVSSVCVWIFFFRNIEQIVIHIEYMTQDKDWAVYFMNNNNRIRLVEIATWWKQN